MDQDKIKEGYKILRRELCDEGKVGLDKFVEGLGVEIQIAPEVKIGQVWESQSLSNRYLVLPKERLLILDSAFDSYEVFEGYSKTSEFFSTNKKIADSLKEYYENL